MPCQPDAQEPALPPGLEPGGDEPELPQGLGGSREPALPEGLGGRPAGEPELPAGLGGAPAEPELPAGLGGASKTENGAPEERTPPLAGFVFTGFAEARGGLRLLEQDLQRDLSLAELRLQTGLEARLERVVAQLTADFVADALADDHGVDLEDQESLIDLREASLAFSPATAVDVKVGRQILTWGTGDLIFVNDLFPKDFVSFFLGRDVEYLKAPSDALKVSLFAPLANLDVVYVPRFDPDRFIDGRRISFFDPGLDRLVGRDDAIAVDRPDQWFDDDEWALRLYRNIGAYEVALYGYDGFWKNPAGTDPVTGAATFPALSTLGASIRGPVLNGIGNAEAAYYASRDDWDGDDPFVRNSEARFLVGYTRELVRDLTIGLQYYLEYMLDHDVYVRTLPARTRAQDADRHVLTTRLTWQTLNQNLEWSLFVFFSPSDEDAYLRPKLHYKIDDQWSAELGANLFVGEEQTFFGQFEEDTNVYFGLRYGF